MRLPLLLTTVLGVAFSFSLAASAASAQTAPAPAPAAEEPAAPTAKPKPRRPAGPRPAQAVVVTNASAATATEVVISGGDKAARTSKPLKPKARTVLKMPKLKGCVVSVAATFEGGGQVDAGEFDICKEKTIRFTD